MDPSVEYREIAGSPGYLVGDDGSVWSRWGSRRMGDTWRRMKGSRMKFGYILIRLVNVADRRKPRYLCIHRLVLETFVGLCPPGCEGCHKNSIPDDNRLVNLRWDTRGENMVDAYQQQRRGRHLTHANLDTIARMVGQGFTLTAIAKELGFSIALISRVNKGEIPKSLRRSA